MTGKRQKVSQFQVILKVNNKSESYRIPANLFVTLKNDLNPYRFAAVPTKAVKCIETGKVFRCARDAMLWLIKEKVTNNYNADTLIKAACKREHNVSCGFHWCFVDSSEG